MSAGIILLLILAILLVIFTLQNSIEISISFFLWEIPNVPLVLLILICILLGYIAATAYFYPRVWKLRKELKKALKLNVNQNNKQETEEIPIEKPGHEGIELEINDGDNDKGFFGE